MEFTLEQALKNGVEAHKAGKLQEADRYYTAILKVQPNIPMLITIWGHSLSALVNYNKHFHFQNSFGSQCKHNSILAQLHRYTR